MRRPAVPRAEAQQGLGAGGGVRRAPSVSLRSSTACGTQAATRSFSSTREIEAAAAAAGTLPIAIANTTATPVLGGRAYCCGDAAEKDKQERTAANAHAEGEYVANDILRRVRGRAPLPPYIAPPRLCAISLGKWDGLVVLGRWVALRGWLAAAAKMLIQFYFVHFLPLPYWLMSRLPFKQPRRYGGTAGLPRDRQLARSGAVGVTRQSSQQANPSAMSSSPPLEVPPVPPPPPAPAPPPPPVSTAGRAPAAAAPDAALAASATSVESAAVAAPAAAAAAATAPRARDARDEWQNQLFDFGNQLGRGNDEATPAVLRDEVCLVPGSPVVRVEVAPGNARRIFTGIDIVAEGCDSGV